MKRVKAKQVFEEALAYSEENYPQEIEWAKGISEATFKNLKSKKFLENYCWVVYASGFKVSIIEETFPRLREAFKNFDLKSLAKMRSISGVLKVFNNERKAECFLNGSKMIAEEGFSAFKKRLSSQGVDMLEELPGIGPITKKHLGKNIGLLDAAKPDIWLTRIAEECNASVDELVSFLSEEYNLSHHVVDLVLWRHSADNNFGFSKEPVS